MQEGDVVKFKEGMYADEIGQHYVVLEMNGDRCFIKHISDLPIPPTSVAKVADLVLVETKEG